MGRLDQALKEFRSCLNHWKKLHNRYASALTLMNVGIIEENIGRIALARRHYGQALALAREVQFVQVEAATQGNLSNLALIEERWQEAFDAAVQALELARRIGDRRSQAIALENQALACLGLGRLEAARESEEEARRLARAIGDRERQLSLDLVAIECHLTAGTSNEGTVAQIGTLLNKAKEMGLNSEVPRILRLQAAAQARHGAAIQAQRTLELALKECRRQKNRSEEKRLVALKTLFSSQQALD
jgi:tetratricopeptide (TPR) repeat protein